MPCAANAHATCHAQRMHPPHAMHGECTRRMPRAANTPAACHAQGTSLASRLLGLGCGTSRTQDLLDWAGEGLQPVGSG
eukprot:31294-Chlamydomonas_euryale.AAC.2